MTELDSLYTRLLRLGFIVLKQAAASPDRRWLAAELEMLHNVPSLIGEENHARHQYYWSQERPAYLNWVASSGNAEAKSRMLTYYQPIWCEMEAIVADMNAMHDSSPR
jgi:hypothetical protein